MKALGRAAPNLDDSANSGSPLYKISTTYVRFALLKASAIFWHLHYFGCNWLKTYILMRTVPHAWDWHVPCKSKGRTCKH
jgi:hypothetical protein